MKTHLITRLLFITGVFLFLGCGSGQEKVTEAQKEMLREMIENRAFSFEAQWAIPLSSADMTMLMNAGLLRPGDAPNRINLMGNPNYLRIHGDSVQAYLPFFGEQQMNVSMNPRDQAIQFDEVVNDLQVNFNENKGRYEIRFSASQGPQGYILFLTVYPNLGANLKVNSSSRDFIGYQGAVKPLEENKER